MIRALYRSWRTRRAERVKTRIIDDAARRTVAEARALAAASMLMRARAQLEVEAARHTVIDSDPIYDRIMRAAGRGKRNQ